jgi:dUTPase
MAIAPPHPKHMFKEMKEVKIYYHGDLKEVIKAQGNLDENGNILESLNHIGGKNKSVFIDLYCAEDITIEAGEFAYINLGVSIKLPEGYFAGIVPRSGLFSKTGLIQTNSFGVIDTNYSSKKDMWKMPVFNLITKNDIKDVLKQFVNKVIDLKGEVKTDEFVNELEFRKVEIKKGTRVCQMQITKVMDDFKFVESDLEGEVERKGFGEGTGK